MEVRIEECLKMMDSINELETALKGDMQIQEQSKGKVLRLSEISCIQEREVEKFIRKCSGETVKLLHSVVGMGRDFLERVEARPKKSGSVEAYAETVEAALRINMEEYSYPYLFEKRAKLVLLYLNEALYHLNGLRYAV